MRASCHVLDNGQDVNQVDGDGATALMGAAERNQVETLRLLLARGAPVDARDPYGNTALIRAAWRWQPDAVEILLDAGADPRRCDQKGQTALSAVRAFHSDDHHQPTAGEKADQRRITLLLRQSLQSKSRPH